MKRYMNAKSYCEETGFGYDLMLCLVKSYLGDRFCFRTSGARNAPYMIIVPVFERMLENQEFKEVIEE